MATNQGNKRQRNGAPPTTVEGAESQMVSLAVELTKKRLTEGTASSQEIVHFLKLGSTREKLEQDRLKAENELLKAKVDQLASAKKVEELYAEALEAMRTYSGQDNVPEVEYYDD